MIDLLLSLSFNIHAQQGVYALLVGSGVSRAASIPTGWEVTLDIIARLAQLDGDDFAGNVTEWYLEKFGKEPDYSEVLGAVAPTSAAQQQLLKAYFEPTMEEREEGKKLPTKAHKAIAHLVSRGYIRVIVTTNFDRLLEAALESEGIVPVVIASPDAAQGAPPLTHSKCTVIKVHGDYLDHRIKNSVKALSEYDQVIDRLLDQVFDEYGLIICGWSGNYDVALRKAMERSKSRRYPMYWTGLSKPEGAAKDLIALRGAQFVMIGGADTFFTSLLEKVEALEEFNRPHPLSTQAAVATLKRYLSEDKYRIHLRDFLLEEANQACLAVESAFQQVSTNSANQHSIQRLMKLIEAGCENLVHEFASGSFYATVQQSKTLFEAFHKIAPKAQSGDRLKILTNLRKYPALLLVYAAGIVAIKSNNYLFLREIATCPSYAAYPDGKTLPASMWLSTHNVLDVDQARGIWEERKRDYTPLSDYIYQELRTCLCTFFPDDNHYESAFDDFEYLWCLLSVDAKMQSGQQDPRVPYGSYIWRQRESDESDFIRNRITQVINDGNKDWAPLKAGLFGYSVDRLTKAKQTADVRLQGYRTEMFW